MKKPEAKKPEKKPRLSAKEKALELQRLDFLAELEDSDIDVEEDYKPGTMGCHELLDRTAYVADSVDQLIHTHPSCVRNPEWYALAEKARVALEELYQKIGAEHLPDQPETSPS